MSSKYDGPERRATLTEEQIDIIATKAAEKAMEKVYADVGKGLVKKLTWIIGAAFVGLLLWMGGKGIPLK